MSALQWLSEVGNPAKRCERKGHRMEARRQRVFLYPPTGIFHLRHVADSAVETFQRCGRCGLETEREIEDRSGLNGLSMSSDKWDRLRRTGRVEE